MPAVHAPALRSFSEDEQVMVKKWLGAVFSNDGNSEGISDKLFR